MSTIRVKRPALGITIFIISLFIHAFAGFSAGGLTMFSFAREQYNKYIL